MPITSVRSSRSCTASPRRYRHAGLRSGDGVSERARRHVARPAAHGHARSRPRTAAAAASTEAPRTSTASGTVARRPAIPSTPGGELRRRDDRGRAAGDATAPTHAADHPAAASPHDRERAGERRRERGSRGARRAARAEHRHSTGATPTCARRVTPRLSRSHARTAEPAARSAAPSTAMPTLAPHDSRNPTECRRNGSTSEQHRRREREHAQPGGRAAEVQREQRARGHRARAQHRRLPAGHRAEHARGPRAPRRRRPTAASRRSTGRRARARTRRCRPTPRARCDSPAARNCVDDVGRGGRGCRRAGTRRAARARLGGERVGARRARRPRTAFATRSERDRRAGASTRARARRSAPTACRHRKRVVEAVERAEPAREHDVVAGLEHAEPTGGVAVGVDRDRAVARRFVRRAALRSDVHPSTRASDAGRHRVPLGIVDERGVARDRRRVRRPAAASGECASPSSARCVERACRARDEREQGRRRSATPRSASARRHASDAEREHAERDRRRPGAGARPSKIPTTSRAEHERRGPIGRRVRRSDRDDGRAGRRTASRRCRARRAARSPTRKPPRRSRSAMIASASAGPMPGSSSSCALRRGVEVERGRRAPHRRCGRDVDRSVHGRGGARRPCWHEHALAVGELGGEVEPVEVGVGGRAAGAPRPRRSPARRRASSTTPGASTAPATCTDDRAGAARRACRRLAVGGRRARSTGCRAAPWRARAGAALARRRCRSGTRRRRRPRRRRPRSDDRPRRAASPQPVRAASRASRSSGPLGAAGDARRRPARGTSRRPRTAGSGVAVGRADRSRDGAGSVGHDDLLGARRGDRGSAAGTDAEQRVDRVPRRAPTRRSGRDRLRSTTKLTMRPGRRPPCARVAPSSSAAIRASARGGGLVVGVGRAGGDRAPAPRTLPLTCTGISTSSSTSYAGSAIGNGSYASVSVVPEPRPQLLGDVRRERREHQHQRLHDLARRAPLLGDHLREPVVAARTGGRSRC